MPWCRLRLEIGIVCTVRCALSLKLLLSLPARTLSVSGDTSVSLLHPSQWVQWIFLWRQRRILSHLFLSPLPLHVSIKEKKKEEVSVAGRQSVHPHERSPTLPSSFFPLQTLRSTDWKWTAVDRQRGITDAESSRWRSWCLLINRLARTTLHEVSRAQTAGWVRRNKTKKFRSLFLRSSIARLGGVKLHFRCCRYILDLNRQQTMLHVRLVARLCLTVSPVRSTRGR